MTVLLKKAQTVKGATLKEDSFGKYLERSTENTTVNGAVVAKKFSWYKRILGLF